MKDLKQHACVLQLNIYNAQTPLGLEATHVVPHDPAIPARECGSGFLEHRSPGPVHLNKDPFRDGHHGHSEGRERREHRGRESETAPDGNQSGPPDGDLAGDLRA